jgi:hypothetical protein
MVDRKQTIRKGPGAEYNLEKPLSPVSTHFLKFQQHPKITPPAGDQAFNT